jgi:hypothetical protein
MSMPGIQHKGDSLVVTIRMDSLGVARNGKPKLAGSVTGTKRRDGHGTESNFNNFDGDGIILVKSVMEVELSLTGHWVLGKEGKRIDSKSRQL